MIATSAFEARSAAAVDDDAIANDYVIFHARDYSRLATLSANPRLISVAARIRIAHLRTLAPLSPGRSRFVSVTFRAPQV